MKQDTTVVIVLSAMILFVSGCVSGPGIDKEKFSELNRTARELKTSLQKNKPCDVPNALIQRLAAGTAALQDRTASKAERDLLAAYSNLLTTYQDGLLLCQYQAQMNKYPFVPAGRIYVFQELDPVVDKYGFSTESHLYPPTGVLFRSIAGNSITVIWENAVIQTRVIDNMTNYN